MSRPREIIKNGAHSIFIEGDTLFLVQNGSYSLDDARQTHAHLEKLLDSVGRAFVIVDQSKAGSTSGEARRFIVDWNKRHKIAGAAIFGGSPVARAAAALVLSFIQFVRREPGAFAFVATEREARAWVAEKRAPLEKKKKKA